MILKGKERGGGAQFGAYLLNGEKNEHVEVHTVSGFMSDNVEEALKEITAMAQGTRCINYMFTVILSPPENEIVETKVFEDAATRIADKLGLQNQPYVLVFHEKDGHRHAHCVWSRIDTEKMVSINLPYYKKKLTALSKELFLEHGWKLPQGFIDRKQRNPLNFTREQWQQAQRMGDDPRTIKAVLKECWSISDSKASFQKALDQRGYYLAKGDQRGYLAVDWRGKHYSLSRWLDLKSKILKERLGRPADFPSVNQVKERIDSKLVEHVHSILGEIKQDYQRRSAPLLVQKTRLRDRHSAERQALADKQAQRRKNETRQRQARMTKGFRGIWDRITGKYASIARQNETDAYEAYTRDKEQSEIIIQSQLRERRKLQQGIKHIHNQRESDIEAIKEKLFSGIPLENNPELYRQFEKTTPHQRNGFDLSM